MATSYTTFDNGFMGVTTLTANDDGTLSAVLDASNALTPISYSGGSVPTVPSGVIGLLVDGIAGAAVTVPAGYGGVIDGAPGASTVDVGSDASQHVLLSPLAGNGPVTFVETGGSGTVYGGAVAYNTITEQSSFNSGNGDGSLFELAGGSYALLLSSAAQTVVASGGSGEFAFIRGGNLISLGFGNYTVDTGGNDTVTAGESNDEINVDGGIAFLGSGNDTVLGESGAIFGGTGNDSIAVASPSTLVANATANLVIYLVPIGPQFRNSTADTVFGGSGSITTTGIDPGVPDFDLLAIEGAPIGQGDLLLGGSAGKNLIIAIATQTTIFGAGAGDTLSAWNGPAGGDIVVAGPGAETVLGNAATGASGTLVGGNLLVGGTGPDLIIGGSSHDTILSGSGNTTIASGSGGSLLALGDGADFVNLGGADTLFAAAGPATIGSAAGAMVIGASGPLMFLNGTRPSTVSGGSGASTIYAGTGGGVFAGGASGGNLLVGGAGNAVFFGGVGAGNVFQFNDGLGGAADLIADFDPARDRVMLSGFAPGTAATALSTATIFAGSVTIALPDATRITFLGVSSLDARSFS